MLKGLNNNPKKTLSCLESYVKEKTNCYNSSCHRAVSEDATRLYTSFMEGGEKDVSTH